MKCSFGYNRSNALLILININKVLDIVEATYSNIKRNAVLTIMEATYSNNKRNAILSIKEETYSNNKRNAVLAIMEATYSNFKRNITLTIREAACFERKAVFNVGTTKIYQRKRQDFGHNRRRLFLIFQDNKVSAIMGALLQISKLVQFQKQPHFNIRKKETPDLVTFTEEILNGKHHFLCSGSCR